jgi:hypothetical protein
MNGLCKTPSQNLAKLFPLVLLDDPVPANPLTG